MLKPLEDQGGAGLDRGSTAPVATDRREAVEEVFAYDDQAPSATS